MTVTGARPDRRPDWLQRKHTGASALDADIRDTFEQLVVQALDAGRPMRLSEIAGDTFGTEDEAKEEGRLVYNTARSLGLSAASRVTDPATGKCELCDGGWSTGQRCQPSPRGGYDLHFAVFAKKNAYAYMLQRYGPDRTKWPYDPLARRGRNVPPAEAAAERRRFGDGRPAAPAADEDEDDSLPADPRPIGTPRTPKPPAASTRPTARGSGSGKSTRQEAPEGGSWLERMRRSLG